MKDNAFARFQSREHLGLTSVVVSDLNRLQPSAVAMDDVDGPLVAEAEHGARRNDQRPVRFPFDDTRLDTESISQLRTMFHVIDEIRNDVDTLLFDAQRGDFREPRGFNEPHAGDQRPFAAPMFEQHFGAGLDAYRVGRQQIDLDFTQWLMGEGVPFVLVFTKVDRVSPTKANANIEAFTERMAEFSENVPMVFPTSAVSKLGIGDLHQLVHQVLTSKKQRAGKEEDDEEEEEE